jgi:hypothetical protein
LVVSHNLISPVTELLTLPGLLAVAFSPDGRLLAGAAGDGWHPSFIHVWEGRLP